MSKNDITGDNIASRIATKEYIESHSRIFMKEWIVYFLDGTSSQEWQTSILADSPIKARKIFLESNWNATIIKICSK